ncbi:hypothetical protein LCGC14_0334990 [marine sediment metagenome]|uniref:Uncharacterized protein n=1 Tax=marine sediment metagenome TaxID=412755 RepID=A0A0F9W2V7_9ZZZZ
MSDRERVAWGVLRMCIFAFLVIVYWEPLPGIAWFMLFVVFTGGVKIHLR